MQKKLAEGLPPIEDKAAAEEPSKTAAAGRRAAAPGAAGQAHRGSAAGRRQQPIPVAYKVQRGQSLWSIAADELGAGSRYIEILDLNPQLQGNPARLMPGQELTLPAPATDAASRRARLTLLRAELGRAAFCRPSEASP